MINENSNTILQNSNLGSTMFLQVCTLDMTIQENKIKLYNSLNKCDIRINDIKGQEIEIVGLYIEGKRLYERDDNDKILYNEKTGEALEKNHYRTILFDKEGKTYVSSAYGVYNSIRTITQIFDLPSEENVIKVKVGTRPVGKTGKESLILDVIQ